MHTCGKRAHELTQDERADVGAWTNLGAVDPATCTRSSSATGYYRPNQNCSNLTVLTEALVEGIELEEQDDGSHLAHGVRFIHLPTNASFTVHAMREVILCAGTVQSPVILELSGIGDPAVLSKAGVDTKVISPRVGENLQDHIMAASIYEVEPTLPNPDDLKADPAAAAAAREEYLASQRGPFTVLANSVCYLSLSQVAPEEVVDGLVQRATNVEPRDYPERDAIRRRRFDPNQEKLGHIEYFLCVNRDPSPPSSSTLHLLTP